MSRPLDRNAMMPELGEVDTEGGEFWVENPFMMPSAGYNLSAYERNRLYVGTEDGKFIDASFASRTDIDSDSRSVVAADFDRDGLEDLLVASVGGGPLRLFRNTGTLAQPGVLIQLQGKQSNRQGVGARLRIVAGERTVLRDLFPQNGGMGIGPAELTVGLGGASKIDRLEVTWPTGEKQVLTDLPGRGRIRVREGADPVVIAAEAAAP